MWLKLLIWVIWLFHIDRDRTKTYITLDGCEKIIESCNL